MSQDYTVAKELASLLVLGDTETGEDSYIRITGDCTINLIAGSQQ